MLTISFLFFLGYVSLTRIKFGRFYFDHLVILLIGLFYYWVFPILAYRNNWIGGRDLRLFNSIPDEKILFFELVSSLIFLSIITGDIISSRYNPRNKELKGEYFLSIKTLDFFLFILVTLTLIYLFLNRNILFKGYGSINWGIERGALIGALCMLSTLSIIGTVRWVRKKGRHSYYRVFINRFVIIALVANLIFLSTGNRGFIITFLVAMMMLLSLNGKTKLWHMILFFGLLLMIAGAVGTIRLGRGFHVLYLINYIKSHIFYETLNVNQSLWHYLINSNEKLFAIPYILVSKLIGLIPTAIFPSKFSYMIKPSDLGIVIPHFQSTSQIYILLMVHFGVLGSVLFMGVLSFILNILKKNPLTFSMYISLSSYIMFHFFRSFDVTVIKFMFEFSILFVLCVFAFDRYAPRKAAIGTAK
jgi:hypothetical protein